MAQLIDGKKVAERVIAEVQAEVKTLKKNGVVPTLAVVLVGNDPASRIYVSNKERKAKQIGIETREHVLPESTSESELLVLVDQLNRDNKVSGILVQFPLPKHMNEDHVREAIAPEKDVDGLHPVNQGKLLSGDETLVPCTPRGIIRLLDEYHIELKGKHAVVIGRSALVGKPLAHLLLNRHATVTLCHSRTRHLHEMAAQADLLCVAVGKSRLVKENFIKKGAVVIDIGINRITENGKIKVVGDVDFEPAEKKASFITPVPGGVGPMTIAMLLLNTVNAAKKQAMPR
ncbi:bifunctional methylenetetrahydrofolate dehydrogenase/methenyltetrahydrofolate cyclohydrolase FolD [Candidatus Micrarchaeota archaeon]|nr:bifunctional methylenetetrahydrofolate dehydrogenase/methenyltetrahydrofolate cyclohydrolase FolD [Candidatus Micrarchaeota archaeon]